LKTKILILSLFASLSQAAFAGNLGAAKATPYHLDNVPFSIADHLDKNMGCGGNARLGYLRSSIGSSKTLSASAIGGELLCGLSLTKTVAAHVGLFSSLDTGLNHSNDNDIHGDFFNQKTDGYLLLGEAHLVVSLENVELHLGRQRLDTPHMDSDDLRMVPNLFEAYMAELLVLDNVHAGMGYVRRMSGWENGGDQADFIGVGDAFGGDGNQAWLAWTEYETALFNTNLWYYRVPDHLQIVYGDVSHEGHTSDGLGYTLAFQYDWGQSIGAANAGEVDAKTWGVLASASYEDVTLSAAYNRNNSHHAALGSLGGGAFYTSMEDQTLDAIVGKKAEALLISLEYSGVNNTTLGVTFGEFKARNKADYDVEELDVYLTHQWHKVVSTDIMYATVNDKNGLGVDHQFRAIVTVSY